MRLPHSLNEDLDASRVSDGETSDEARVTGSPAVWPLGPLTHGADDGDGPAAMNGREWERQCLERQTD